MINVMLIPLGKTQSTTGESHQPPFMSSRLTISHTCLLCQPTGRTLPYWTYLFVIGRVVSRERWESSELGRLERTVE